MPGEICGVVKLTQNTLFCKRGGKRSALAYNFHIVLSSNALVLTANRPCRWLETILTPKLHVDAVMPARQTANYSTVYGSTECNRIEALFVQPPTSEPIDDVEAWRSRPLDNHYALVFFDSLLVKVREHGLVKNLRIHLALGVSTDGGKDIIGHWVDHPMSERFWPEAIEQLSRRGVASIDIAVTEQLVTEDAIRLHFPGTRVGAAAVEQLPPALRAVCATTSAVRSVIEKRRRRGLVKDRSFVSAEAAVRDLLLVLQDANSGWNVAPGRWAAAKLELLTLRQTKTPHCNKSVKKASSYNRYSDASASQRPLSTRPRQRPNADKAIK